MLQTFHKLHPKTKINPCQQVHRSTVNLGWLAQTIKWAIKKFTKRLYSCAFRLVWVTVWTYDNELYPEAYILQNLKLSP